MISLLVCLLETGGASWLTVVGWQFIATEERSGGFIAKKSFEGLKGINQFWEILAFLLFQGGHCFGRTLVPNGNQTRKSSQTQLGIG